MAADGAAGVNGCGATRSYFSRFIFDFQTFLHSTWLLLPLGGSLDENLDAVFSTLPLLLAKEALARICKRRVEATFVCSLWVTLFVCLLYTSDAADE